MLNPSFPAAVGMRRLTCARLRSLIFGAFSLAIPERMPAAPAGFSSIVNVMTTDERTRGSVIAAINPVVGGGCMPERDGFERVWTARAYDGLTRLLAALPVHWRFFVKTKLFAEMREADGVLSLDAAYAAVRRDFPQIPDAEAAAALSA